MRILSIGGGPAGLYFALLMKLQDPNHVIRVVERNRAYDTFGWGVVLSDQTLANLRRADPVSAAQIGDAFNHWDDIEVFYRNQTIRSSGHGFCGIGRKHLLNILQARCEALGVELLFEQDVDDNESLAEQFNADLVIAADGLNSRIRQRYAQTYQPNIDMRDCRFVWLGTHKKFDAFTFAFVQTEHGWFAAHAYQYDADTSTFIVETPQAVWQAHGLDTMTQEQGIEFCERLFADYLDGNRLMSNASHLRGSAIWIQFPRVICEHWVHFPAPTNAANNMSGRNAPVVLMGDAAHTAHFSIGSGTKLALEDAIDLANNLKLNGATNIKKTLDTYEKIRSVEVLKIQNAARNSTEWFEHVNRYTALEAQQFTYSLLTRSQRISHENLRARDGKWLASFEQWLAQKPVNSSVKPSAPVLPMLLPLTVRGLTLPNRIVVSPMATYSAVQGVVQDFHLVHLGARALGGAGLVFVEMTSPTVNGRISSGCPVLSTDQQEQSLARIVKFIHQNSQAKVALQLGHSGPKGSTQLGWQQTDEPIIETAGQQNWPVIGASEIAFGPTNQTPQALTEPLMRELIQAFVGSTERARKAGFDWIELHCAHGYLLSSFICPLTNNRQDQYGGSIENRCRFPLAVFTAMRAVWPEHLPMSVRISAHDWALGGNTDDDAVQIARLFKAAGADVIDVSSGQTTRQARPVYGRMYQTPFSDRIRNEVGIKTIAVGAISQGDQANSIIASGRADLCAVARPHLSNPAWTLHETAKLAAQATEHRPAALLNWPKPYWAGRDQYLRELAKDIASLTTSTAGAQQADSEPT
jgi:anthraniloyl-CoA monooxygenase